MHLYLSLEGPESVEHIQRLLREGRHEVELELPNLSSQTVGQLAGEFYGNEEQRERISKESAPFHKHFLQSKSISRKKT